MVYQDLCLIVTVFQSDSEESEELGARQGTISQESGVGIQRLDSTVEEETKLFSVKARWLISSGVTTQHLLSVISTANTLMSMNHATFKIPRRNRRTKRFVHCEMPVCRQT